MKSTLLTMSLKRYLFIAISLFVLVMAATQVLFIHYIQQQIAFEVEDKSRTLSKQALDLLVETLPPGQPRALPQNDKPLIEIRITDTPNKVVDLGDGVSFTSGDQTRTVSLRSITPGLAGRSGSSRPSAAEVENRLMGELDTVDFHRLEGTYAFKIELPHDPEFIGESTSQRFVQFDPKDSSVNRYFSMLLIATLALTCVGLVFAYWMARFLSRPLASLSGGFRQLEQGNLGSQVTPVGIAEMRNTLDSFNHMSQRLSELKQLELRLGQQQHLAELGDVSRGLAHTLRNPVNTIGLAIEQMSQADCTDLQRQDLALKVRQKINHLDNTIKALLDLSANDINRRERVNLKQVIQDVVLEASTLGQTRVNISGTSALIMFGSEAELRAIVHTLVMNALEASPSGSAVEVETHLGEQTVEIMVKDQGHGVAPQVRSRLFQPHVTTKAEGAGMGLYIARRLCQLHYHGDLHLSDNQPRGCIATAVLSLQHLAPLQQEGQS